MPITTDLNIDPYFDDFNIEKQFYKVLFKPAYAVQARELTQMQTVLQNQIERFGNNIFKEGTIIRGCNFTELDDLEYVKVRDRAATTSTAQFDPTVYVGSFDGTEEIRYEIEGQETGLRASIVTASRGFETRPPDLNTFYINYLNTNDTQQKRFIKGEELVVKRVRIVNDVVQPLQAGDDNVDTINVTNLDGHVGRSFGLRAAEGVIYQRGHFLFTEEQLVIVSKYTNYPENRSVGYLIQEELISYLEDNSLLDNANGYLNENAPGADRLKLTPILTVRNTAEADADTTFFTLSRYVSGNAVQVRDVTEYNVIGNQMAVRTKESVGDYISRDFDVSAVRFNNANTVGANTNVAAAISPGVAYVEGFRVESVGTQYIPIDNITETNTVVNRTVSFNYGGYTNIESISGTVPFGNFTPVQLRNGGGTQIGNALVKNITPQRIYLFNVQMNTSTAFGDVEQISDGVGTIALANNTILRESTNSTLLFDTGMFSLKNVDNVFLPLRQSSSSFTIDTGNDELVISAPPNYDFDGVSNTPENLVVVDGSNTLLSIDSVDVAINKLSITINLTPGQSPTTACTVYYNIRAQDAVPHPKLSRNVFIKNTFASGTTKYNLGFPDVYKIVSITDANGTDVTSSFRLNYNQRDNFYDHSYIELLPGRATPANGTLTINMLVFEPNKTQGIGFYTVASYPTDVPANEIPVFKSASGKIYSLRECVDFRPHVDPVATADYNASTAGAAPTIAPTINLTPSFSGTMIVPSIASSGNADYEYYLSRRDAITIDRYGKFALIKGDESEDAIPPSTIGTGLMRIADIYIPGFPMLSPEESADLNRPRYAVKAVKRGPKAYRMSDIQDLQRSVEQLRYYVVLSQIEAATRNLNVVDDTGRSRFKNGIIVDPFNDLSIADITSQDFDAAIDRSEKSLTPKIRSFPLNLVYKSGNNATIFPSVNDAKVATLGRDQNTLVLEQPYATSYRNCVSNFWSYKGSGSIEPEYEVGYDMVTNPLPVEIDLFGPISQLVENINEIVPLTRTDVEEIWRAETARTEVITEGNVERTFSVIDRTLEDVTRTLQLTPTDDGGQTVGDFVTDFDFKPYMRSTELKIWMTGLRPNTQHYFFFDEQTIDDHVAPGSPVDSVTDVEQNGEFGTAITTDSTGTLRAVFFIPEETFFVGDRKLEIMDVEDYETAESAATSYGTLMYRAYNFGVEKGSLTITTRMPSSEVVATRSNRRPSEIRTLTGERRIRRKDPLAQTFFVKEALGIEADTIFVSAIDLYFKRKSTTNGVHVMLREVVNGVPSDEIIPFSKVHLTSAQVSVSDDSSLATTISFRMPIRLNADKEYAIVVMPDANDPDYLIYTCKVGENDLIDGLPVNNDWGDGVLFTSTNNRAWQSYQDEDIKFTLYRHNFNQATGSITLKNDDHEFLTIENSVGKFRTGEFVYIEEALAAGTANTISVAEGENTITGTALGDTFAVGDYVLFDDGVNKDYFRVTTVSGNILTVNKPAAFTSTGACAAVVGGKLVHYDTRNPNSLVVIEHSNATPTKYIQANDTLYGYTSGAYADVASVDNINLSYLQPMILRTNDTFTRTTMSGRFTRADNSTLNFIRNVKFNDSCRFNGQGMVLFSRSNDTTEIKPFELTIAMENGGNVTTSPFIDIETAKVFAYQYQSTNSSDTCSKYVSRSVELAEDLDAEDFQLYLTAYRPAGTNIKVYVRAQNVYDPISIENAEWNELELFRGENTFSATDNIHDFKEYVYRLPESLKNVDGVYTYTNEDGAEFETYGRFAVKIEMLSENIYNVPRILDYRGIALT